MNVLRRWLMLSPVMIPVLLVFGAGIIITALGSFGEMNGVRGGAYRELLSDGWFIPSFLFSAAIAGVSATIATAAGLLLALLLWRLPDALRARFMGWKIPLVLPHMAVAYLVLLTLGGGGIAASIAHHAGFTLPELTQGAWGIDIVLGYVYKETPFAALLIGASLLRINPDLISTARMLGAGRLHTFRTVVFPGCAASVHSAFLILFIYSFGAFDLPFVLGSSWPGMVALRVYAIWFQRPLAERPLADAMLMLMLLFSVVFIALYLRIAERLSAAERRL